MRRVLSLPVVFGVFATVLSGCAASERVVAVVPNSATGRLTPMQAVFAAAESAPRSVRGVFELQVAGGGRQDGNTYLNSESDYRDPRNLTIAVLPGAEAELQNQHRTADLVSVFRGRRIAVTGEARKTRIDFTANGRGTGKYYFQTHVRVTRASQIQLLD